MTKQFILVLASLTASLACAQENATPAIKKPQAALPPAATNASARSTSISVQEMLVMGPSGLKLHSLAMITQGKYEGKIDESFLPGFKVCADDPALPVRSVTARLIGEHFVQGQETPNPEAEALLKKLAQDTSSDVRYNAVYHGLSQLMHKSDEILSLLIDIAASDREQNLYDRINESLAGDRERVTSILNNKLKDGDSVAIYEIYQDLTGTEPANADKYLDMPSSRPRLFIFRGEGNDPEVFKEELEEALKQAGITNPDVSVSGRGENYVLLLKTYITKDYLAVEKAFPDNEKFRIDQQMWLTPEIEVQIDAMKTKK